MNAKKLIDREQRRLSLYLRLAHHKPKILYRKPTLYAYAS